MPLDLDRLRALVRQTPPFVLHPRAFFAAWSGVLVVAFGGFPRVALRLQQALGELPDAPPLLPGARWPKVTLAALRTGANLTRDEGRALLALCAEWSPRIATAEPLQVDSLALVDFACCSLEARERVETVPLEGDSPPPASDLAHRRAVERVLHQPDRFETYWPYLARPGHRESHYRTRDAGQTLVYDWLSAGQPSVIDVFLDAVDEALPGRYARFSPESRHVTLHNL